jgi:hypothetical protein
MQIAQELAGYTLGGADMLRRAMGKKKPEEMAKQRAVFKQGSVAKGVDGELAMKIFDLVEKATVSTNPTRRPTPWCPTRPPGSRPITRRPSWRR